MTVQVVDTNMLTHRFFQAFDSRPRPLASEILRPEVNIEEGTQLRALLAASDSKDITVHELRSIVEGNLWMLTPAAFLYFLPAFFNASLESYEYVSIFASELIGALTLPARSDVEDSIDQIANHSAGIGLSGDMVDLLRKQQYEWFDSGTPAAIFHDRFDGITPAEGAAILSFLIAFQKAHGENFPFDEIATAIDRYWVRYRHALEHGAAV